MLEKQTNSGDTHYLPYPARNDPELSIGYRFEVRCFDKYSEVERGRGVDLQGLTRTSPGIGLSWWRVARVSREYTSGSLAIHDSSIASVVWKVPRFSHNFVPIFLLRIL